MTNLRFKKKFYRKQKEDVPKPMKRRKKDGNERSPYWKFFDKRMNIEDDGVERKYAQCKFCKSLLKSDPNRNGTSTKKTCREVQKKKNR